MLRFTFFMGSYIGGVYAFSQGNKAMLLLCVVQILWLVTIGDDL
jgi:hypothetical protein